MSNKYTEQNQIKKYNFEQGLSQNEQVGKRRSLKKLRQNYVKQTLEETASFAA